jgi:hypothetical protein
MSHDNGAASQPEGVEIPTVTSECLSIIDRYRAEQIQKGDAIYELTQTIPDEEIGATESVGKTLGFYVVMLDDWDRERTLSDADEREREGRGQPEHGDDSRGQKQANQGGFDVDDECDEPIHKRPKIDLELFPWVASVKAESSSLREECVATKNLIANYTIDVKQAKTHLLNSGVAPEFPDSEWKSILSGLAVNLDIVFSGRYSTEHDPQITQEIGDFTILTREVATSKSVRSAGDWFIAWNQAAAATAFAFPH